MNNKKQFWVGTSWKMNKTLEEAVSFSKALLADDHNNTDSLIQRFVIPPFPLIHQVKEFLMDSTVKVGAQNMHWADKGAWTGEVSPVMLSDAKLDVVELGHSERREHFAETNETVGRKVAAAVHHGLIPLICIGETLEDKNNGNAGHFLAEQVRGALKYLVTEEQKKAQILFAYEPIWAIGEHGIPASSEYADLRHAEIIDLTFQLLGQCVPCLYGGSVNQDNCEELIACEHIGGLFIGRAAWDVSGYIAILNKCLTVINSN